MHHNVSTAEQLQHCVPRNIAHFRYVIVNAHKKGDDDNNLLLLYFYHE